MEKGGHLSYNGMNWRCLSLRIDHLQGQPRSSAQAGFQTLKQIMFDEVNSVLRVLSADEISSNT